MGRATAHALLASIALLACKSEGSAPVAVSGTARAASATGATSAGPAAAATGFPPVEDTCVSTDDCATTEMTAQCCMQCATTAGNKAWLAKVATYCDGVVKSGATAHCPATLCKGAAASQGTMLGYLNALPECKSGHCVKPHG